MPKFHLLYWRHILDEAIKVFISEHEDDFVKNDNNEYVLSADLTKAKIKRELLELSKTIINKQVSPWNLLDPHWYLLLGGCDPRDNMLLDLRTSEYVPAKLDKMLKSDICLKYFLKEKDIKIDIACMNDLADAVFNELFKNPLQDNIIFIKHRRLDCYSMFKIIKHIYGRSCCINMSKDIDKQSECLVATNDLIDKYIANKSRLNNLHEFKVAVAEIKEFLKRKTSHE